MSCFEAPMVIGQSRVPEPPASTMPRRVERGAARVGSCRGLLQFGQRRGDARAPVRPGDAEPGRQPRAVQPGVRGRGAFVGQASEGMSSIRQASPAAAMMARAKPAQLVSGAPLK
jgi:hypothetical protein